jgi:hypothetical protein
MELSPETLGKITIELEYTTSGLELKISAENENTAHMISSQITELEHSLSAGRVDVRSIDVGSMSLHGADVRTMEARNYDFITMHNQGTDTSGNSRSFFSDLSGGYQPPGENRGTDSGPYTGWSQTQSETADRTEEYENLIHTFRHNQMLNYLV